MLNKINYENNFRRFLFFFTALYVRLLLKLNLFYIIFNAVGSLLDPFTLFEKKAPQYVTILIIAKKSQQTGKTDQVLEISEAKYDFLFLLFRALHNQR